jgi:hypothetical protein
VLPDRANDVLSLPVAAAIAYRQVFSTRREPTARPSTDELDLVALALSLHLPIYGVRPPENKPARISEPELLEGMFWGGAARFESRHRLGAVFRLTVKKSELERVLQQLRIERSDAWQGS